MPWLRSICREGVKLEPVDDRALLALQGPKAADVLATPLPEGANLPS